MKRLKIHTNKPREALQHQINENATETKMRRWAGKRNKNWTAMG